MFAVCLHFLKFYVKIIEHAVLAYMLESIFILDLLALILLWGGIPCLSFLMLNIALFCRALLEAESKDGLVWTEQYSREAPRRIGKVYTQLQKLSSPDHASAG